MYEINKGWENIIMEGLRDLREGRRKRDKKFIKHSIWFLPVTETSARNSPCQANYFSSATVRFIPTVGDSSQHMKSNNIPYTPPVLQSAGKANLILLRSKFALNSIH